MNNRIQKIIFSFLVIFLLTIPFGLPSTVFADATQCKPISAPYTTKDRFGLSGNDGDNPAIADLGVSWYMNWGYKPDNSSSSIEYLPMVLHTQSEDFASYEAFKSAIMAVKTNSPEAYGNCTTWLIGNEIGFSPPVGGNEKYPPEKYAEYFKKYADWISQLGTELGVTYKLAAGSVITRPDLQLHVESKTLPNAGPKIQTINGSLYMEKVLKIYKIKYGTKMPVDVFQLHPYMFDGKIDFKINMFKQSVTSFRSMLQKQGYKDKEVWITEWGNLVDDKTIKTTFDDSIQIMNAGILWLTRVNSSTDGMARDSNKLVQRWGWFTLKYLSSNPDYAYQHKYTYMFDPTTQQLNSLGLNYKRLIAQYTDPNATPSGTRTPTPTKKPPKPTDPDGVPGLNGDMNGDKQFNIFDINEFVERFGLTGQGKRDLDNSGTIDKEDFTKLIKILKNAYGG